MNLQRKRRLYFILLIMSGVSIAVALSLYALKQNINLFYTPSQVVAGAAPANHGFRMGGLVQRSSLYRTKDLQVSFVVTDLVHQVTVHYTGILPDLFKEGQGVVVEGSLNAQRIFIAQQVLAKHDEKYMPPPVAATLKKSNS